jgi:hypothetical protein
MIKNAGNHAKLFSEAPKFARSSDFHGVASHFITQDDPGSAHFATRRTLRTIAHVASYLLSSTREIFLLLRRRIGLIKPAIRELFLQAEEPQPHYSGQKWPHVALNSVKTGKLALAC